MTSIVETFFRKHANPGWICESETLRFAEINDAAVRRYDLPVASFRSLTLRDLQPGTSPRLTSVRMMRDDLQPNQDETLQHHFIDGSVLELTLRGIALDIGGRGYRLVISRDIGHQAPRSRASRQLAYIDRQSARIARIGGWRFDMATRTFTYSAAAHDILNLRQTDSGRPDSVLDAIAPDDRAPMRLAFRTCMDLGERIDRAFTVAGPQGRPRRLWMIAEPEFDVSGEVVGILGVVQDMSSHCARDEALTAPQRAGAVSLGKT